MSGAVAAAFEDAVARWSERPFLEILPETAGVYGIAPATYTYARAAEEVERVARRYRAAGYGVGHRVGLMLENRPDVFFHWFALNGLGVSVVPLNVDLRPAELDYLITHSELCLAVGAPPRMAALQEAAGRVGTCVAASADADPMPRAPREPDGEANARTECALLYTSGTTGKPKGCVLSNAYFMRCGTWYAELDGLCALRPGEERLITPLPMVHVNAMAFSTLAMVLTGGCNIPLDRFHPRSWWQSVRDSEATILHSLGVMPTMLLGLDPSPLDRAHRVRFGFAPAVDPRYHALFEERFGIPMIDAWSMTETGAGGVVIANREPRHVGQSCFGRAEPFMELRLVDQDGRAVADGTPGEMLVRAPGADPRAGFFTEYLKDPAATEAGWAGGWFHTGDVVRRDAEGNLYFVDRWKNVIRRSGENIAAVEVESVLRRHALVREVACTGVADELRGEEVLACIVPREPVQDPERVAAELVALALDELAYFKAPGYVAFLDRLPLTSTNKMQRGELKVVASTLPGSAGCVDTRHLKKRRVAHA
jgi:acyl-CoA synthetase (AMP-forming)/AMP-acid ligase II